MAFLYQAGWMAVVSDCSQLQGPQSSGHASGHSFSGCLPLAHRSCSGFIPRRPPACVWFQTACHMCPPSHVGIPKKCTLYPSLPRPAWHRNPLTTHQQACDSSPAKSLLGLQTWMALKCPPSFCCRWLRLVRKRQRHKPHPHRRHQHLHQLPAGVCPRPAVLLLHLERRPQGIVQ